MKKCESGYSIIELLFVIAILGLVLAGGSNMFVNTARNFKQQGKIAETNIEGNIGLEMLRRDLESAGYGLPWSFPVGMPAYTEAANATAALYNDSTTNAPPRAVQAGDNIVTDPGALGVVNGSDYLVIKATTIARNDPSARWGYLMTDGTTTGWVTSGKESIINNDRVIVLSPGMDMDSTKALVLNTTGGFFAKYTGNASISGFLSPKETRIIYGVSDGDLIRPFNRADYYVSTTVARPGRCANNTGVLVKAILNQSDGSFTDILPVLDCVADMQVVTFLDTTGAGSGYTQTDGINLSTALMVRSQLKEIRVYILAQQGQKDTNHNITYAGNAFHVGPAGSGRDFVMTTIPSYQNYRWKLYTLIVRPNNLR